MSRTVTVVRAVLALLWAGALVLVAGDGVPDAAAVLLATYPAIDVVASLLGRPGRALRVNAAIGVVAIVAVAVTAFGGDAGATLIAFGLWAAVSGALQLFVALSPARRGERRQLALVVSGGLSVIAGLGFVRAGGMDDASLVVLAGYMAFGAVLFLVSASRRGLVAS